MALAMARPRTTVHVATFPLASTEIRVVVLDPPRPLPEWCMGNDVDHAIVGGFYTRATGIPLGELRTHGVARRSEPFAHPGRSCLHIDGGRATIAPRDELPADPRGDLLQAGPLLVRDGKPLITPGVDPEGFSAVRDQFDSDITDGRYPRAALGFGGGRAIAVAVDGRSDEDAGLTLAELAHLMARLGARDALNLDGGGSTSLVADGALVNRPRDDHGAPPHRGRPICTAIAFIPAIVKTRRDKVPLDDLAAASRRG
jgi:hypothetical protein